SPGAHPEEAEALHTPPCAAPNTLPHSCASLTGVVCTVPGRPSTGFTVRFCADLVTNGATIGSPRLASPWKLSVCRVGAPPPGCPACSLTPFAASCAWVTAVASVQTVGSLRILTPGSFSARHELHASVRSMPLDEVRSPS